MTTVQYGGGPTLEQRRAFANLRPGSHIPGYCGYSPQLKFMSGKSYGEQTSELAKTQPHKKTIDFGCSSATDSPAAAAAAAAPAAAVDLRLPQSSGDNKYFEGMLPGYTGYVPTLINRFGGTYRHLADESVDNFVRSYDRQQSKSADLSRSANSLPQLTALRGDPALRDHLNFWADRQPKPDSKRANPEPPIPGYKGFVPRVYTTQAGLGCRYHEMTRNGLQAFQADAAAAAAAAASGGAGPGRAITARADVGRESVPLEGNRVFRQEGMKPAYTGYVPRRRFNFGHTYGETTRQLPVCKHSYPSYGNFVRSLTSV